ncbi:hypothetical protein BGZ70_009673, partial [Mortierella alpina]
MGKLTSLLKKKKSRGDGLTSSDLQEKAGSTLSGISVETAPPLSLSIPATTMGEGTSSSDLQASFSLMDDIMDQLAGTTPDTPQPTLPSSSSDFSDFGLAFELSRQLDQGITSTEKELGSSSAGQGVASTTTTTTTTKIGKLEQNRAFKDNAFLKNQQRQQQQNPASSNINSLSSSSIPSAQTRRLSEKRAEEIERAAEAAARLREASKKANAQLPSDDEGSSSSDSDGSDDEVSPRRRRQQQQKLLQMQQQQAMLQLQQQQQLPYLAGEPFLSNAGSPRRSDGGSGSGSGGSKKPQPINHEAVIDRMKDRHRALLAGAAAAARDEYYEEYMDEYGLAQPLQAPGSMMAYNMQYGVDPTLMYGVDEFRFARECGSDVSSSQSNSVNNGETMMPARPRFRQQSTASSARASEDSWADPYPVLSSAGKSYSNEGGQGGMTMAATVATTATAAAPATQQVQGTGEDSMVLAKDTTLTAEDDLVSEKADAAVDEMTKVVE